MQAMPERSNEPPIYELIATITSASSDPIFKTKRFKSALEDYQVNGVYVRPKPSPTKEQLEMYEARRRKILENFIWNNRLLINILKS